ncbi:hypothetical protein BGX33_009638 [Mortierella sp. NVP41]|nr:hypothetical protein BGX33_009638 [Mortierella sp. NVP41]
MCLTYDGLATVLQTNIVGSPTQPFRQTGVTLFASALEAIFSPEPVGPSLLSYFPNLRTLSTWTNEEAFTLPTVKIKEEILRYCPSLTGYRLDDNTGAIVSKFCANIAMNISEVAYPLQNTSLETIIAILLHQATLKSVVVFHEQGFDFEAEKVTPVSDHFQESGQFLLLIPRCCSQLEILDLYFHEMDMDEIEKGDWACKNLRTLRIRIKGLNTEDKILMAIAIWRAECRKRWQEKAREIPVIEDQDMIDMSIEARVARHLLKFEMLWWVWLGYKTWALV